MGTRVERDPAGESRVNCLVLPGQLWNKRIRPPVAIRENIRKEIRWATSEIMNIRCTRRWYRQPLAVPRISGDGIQSFPVALPLLAGQTRIVAEVERRLSAVGAVVSVNLKRAVCVRHRSRKWHSIANYELTLLIPKCTSSTAQRRQLIPQKEFTERI
jgi:hypothetical protein